jgi:hypothetical protein
MLVAEKGVPAVVVAAIEQGEGDFIDTGVGKKVREEARSGGKKARERAMACERRRRVEVAQHRRDVSPAPLSPLRQSCYASVVCYYARITFAAR